MLTDDVDDFCFVAWRGTTSSSLDWVQNINVRPKYIGEHECPVNWGFWQSYAGDDNFTSEHFVPILNEFIDTCMSKPNKQLVFTGHSQGGAAASVAHLANTHHNPLTIPFGSPSFLNQLVDFNVDLLADCEEAFDKECLWRFINSENYNFPISGNGIVYDLVANLDTFLSGVVGPHAGPFVILPPGWYDGSMSPDTSSVAGYNSDERMSISYTQLGLPDKATNVHSMGTYRSKIRELANKVPIGGTLDTSGFIYGSTCSHQKDCKSHRNDSRFGCFNYQCQEGNDWDICHDDSNCKSERCEKDSSLPYPWLGKCHPRLPNGSWCNEDSDCISENCNWRFKCTS